uniref:Uncharacterized protein n=1 Tax=Physcomitrium patens TaxID=3218 RepID=A0A2K1IJ97_PHYPA|nr:hypothetical protein PHYPA_028043 [Physcomitrium patens]
MLRTKKHSRWSSNTPNRTSPTAIRKKNREKKQEGQGESGREEKARTNCRPKFCRIASLLFNRRNPIPLGI